MALYDNLQVLMRVPLFSSLGREELRLLAFASEPRAFQAGDTLCHAGEAADGALVLVSGTVAMIADREGSGQRFSTLQRFSLPSTLIGELALIVPSSHSETLVADTDVQALFLSRAQFKRFLDDFPDAAAAFHARMSEDLEQIILRAEQVAGRIG
jgi:CRP-like cAMP-binding protein